jgi:hypothetical protein
MDEEDLISNYVIVQDNHEANVTLDYSEANEVDATKVSILHKVHGSSFLEFKLRS